MENLIKMNRKGEIIPDELWRKRILNDEKMEFASQLTAHRIVKELVLKFFF